MSNDSIIFQTKDLTLKTLEKECPRTTLEIENRVSTGVGTPNGLCTPDGIFKQSQPVWKHIKWILPFKCAQSTISH